MAVCGEKHDNRFDRKGNLLLKWEVFAKNTSNHIFGEFFQILQPRKSREH